MTPNDWQHRHWMLQELDTSGVERTRAIIDALEGCNRMGDKNVDTCREVYADRDTTLGVDLCENQEVTPQEGPMKTGGRKPRTDTPRPAQPLGNGSLARLKKKKKEAMTLDKDGPNMISYQSMPRLIDKKRWGAPIAVRSNDSTEETV